MCQTFPLLCSHSTIYIPPIASYLFSDSHILLKMPVNFKRQKIIHREFRSITAITAPFHLFYKCFSLHDYLSPLSLLEAFGLCNCEDSFFFGNHCRWQDRTLIITGGVYAICTFGQVSVAQVWLACYVWFPVISRGVVWCVKGRIGWYI